MSTLAVIVNKAASKLPLEEIATILNTVAGIKSQLSAIGSEFAENDTIEILDQLLTGDVGLAADIDKVLADVDGLTSGSVAASWKKMRSSIQESRLQKLLTLARSYQQLEQNPDLPRSMSLDLLEFEESASREIITDRASVAIEFSAAAGANLDLIILATSAQEFKDNAPALPSGVNKSLPAGKALLSMEMAGKLLVGGELALSASIFNVSAGASRNTDASIKLAFLDDQQARTGSSIAKNMRAAFSSIDNGFTSVSGLDQLLFSQQLFALQFKSNTALRFNASVGVAMTFAENDQIKAKFGHKLEREFLEQGEFEYLVSDDLVEGHRVISIQLRRLSSVTDTINKKFSLDIDPTGLFKRYQPLVSKHLGKAKAIIEQYSEMLPGSDFLRSELNTVVAERISNDDTRELIESVVDGTGGKSASDVLRDIIVGRAEETIDGWTDDANRGANKLAQKMITELAPVYPDIGKLEDKIIESAEAAISSKFEKLKLLTRDKYPSDSIDGFIAELEQAGEKIVGVLDDYDDKIEAVSSKIADILSRLTAVIDKLDAYTRVATEKGIMLALASKTVETDSEELNLRFDLYPQRDRATAQQLFDSIMKGDIASVLDTVRAYRHNEGSVRREPVIVAHGGMYKRYLAMTDDKSMELVLWDLKLGESSIVDASVDWQQNLDGSITVATKSYFEKKWEQDKERRSVQFTTSAEMLFASKQSTVNMGLTLSYEDEELHASEVKTFLEGLTERGVLPEKAVNKAINIINNTDNRVLKDARLDIGLGFDNKQLDALLGHVRKAKTESPCEKALCRLPRICLSNTPGSKCHAFMQEAGSILAEVIKAHHRNQNFIDEAIAVAEFAETGPGLYEGITGMTNARVKYAERIYDPDSYEQPRGITGEADFQSGLFYLQQRRRSLAALFEALSHIRQIKESGKALGADPDTEDYTIPGWTPDALKHHNARIGYLLSAWWLWDERQMEFFRPLGAMHDLTIAMFEILVELSRGRENDGEPAKLWLSLSVPDEASGAVLPRMLT